MLGKLNFSVFLLLIIIIKSHSENAINYCEKFSKELDQNCKFEPSHFSKKRYILYDVNPPEGFNLRRDVYIRVSNFVNHLNQESSDFQWILVLPPWDNLYHWQSNNIGSQNQLPWGLFFDTESLKKYIPVIEMYDFLKEYRSENDLTLLDVVYILQNDIEMFKTGKFEDKNIVTDCSKFNIPYKKENSRDFYSGHFWSYSNITANKIECVIFHGTTFDLKINLKPNDYRSVMFSHMEIPLHHAYGSVEYWKARRSMRYNQELHDIANNFRLTYLNSSDKDDKIEKPTDWRLEKAKRNAKGGPYLSVHFRRQDFILGHAASSSTVEDAAFQIKEILEKLKLNTVFISTDTSETEYAMLKQKLSAYGVFRFNPTKSIKMKYKDGGIAIIDQIICSHARYFLGTHESTFTFRIQEDREILGFSSNTTFNKLCGNKKKCTSGGKWKIVWD